MTSRLDELFSLDRLRQNWQKPQSPAVELPPNAINQQIQAKYHALQGLIAENYPDISRLAGRFDELSEAIKQTYPLDWAAVTVDAKQKEAIIERLEQLEELLWALGLPGGEA